MPDVRYVRVDRPLVHAVDHLRRIARGDDLKYAVYDSVAFATDGPPEAAEAAAGYYRAVRQIGIGSLHIAHITKGENSDRRPFGSTFWFNGARAVWYCQRAETGSGPSGEINIALHPRKANLGPLGSAVGFRITFDDERTAFDSRDVADVEELAQSLPLWQRMRAALKLGARTVPELARELEAKEDTISKAVRRHDKVFTRVVGPGGACKIGLVSRRAE
jgi:hypothetical protein